MSVALAYHQATKYDPESINQHPGLDWATQPLSYKMYHSALAVEMADLLPIDPNPFTGEPRTGPDEDIEGPSLLAVSHWLYFTYGVTAAIANQPRPLYLRAAPSAGGLYPAELYLVVRSGVPGLDPGLYGYDPLKHRLVPLAPGEDAGAGLDAACYGDAAVKAAPLALIVTGVFARSAWRYRERAYRRILLDSGHVIGNALLLANHLLLRPHLTAAFCDARLEDLLRLDADEEGALAVIAAGVPDPTPRPSWSALPSPTSKGEPAGPLLNALHAAGRLGAE
nr:SagB/ThcOx family dehydrogenase [Planctomycetota bacterium]